ncbi:hypothetical protein [Agrobacterium tumefaciens]|uniref:hypothetical protein n=1 Tax=Agrobacterium tumefaciens TaxID=358 RepID=UPI0021D17C7B|nr:hypothetical protein [Agrobacterium tumefaciens]UXS05303.1 hypothetical protein FY156_27410 [Agrobacterium tumefaciens]
MNSFVFLSSRFLSPLDNDHTLDPSVKGSNTHPVAPQFSNLDPQPFPPDAHPGLKDEIDTVSVMK